MNIALYGARRLERFIADPICELCDRNRQAVNATPTGLSDGA